MDMIRKLVKGLLAIFALLAGAILYYGWTPVAPNLDTAQIIQIKKGAPNRENAHKLAELGLISNADFFYRFGQITRRWNKVKAGEYELRGSMSPWEIYNVLTSGISISYPVTIKEGDNMYQVADALDAAGFASRETVLELCNSLVFIQRALKVMSPLPATLNGYLFPDTYLLQRGMGADEILILMVKRFEREWEGLEKTVPLALPSQVQDVKLNKYELLTLASMVEKETGAAAERPMIASVFYNRLHKHMRLESDPTTIYGIWESYKGNITRKDLTHYTEYNTYTIPGLPVGPISNPGTEALKAVRQPSTSNYLFFVSHNDGTHEFTRSFAEHKLAVRRFQLDPKAREGKSWRDLKKATHP
jgi:UPF0755 protein